MEGPGGYQLVGRTTQVWNPRDIASGTPWRLRAFDQLRFHPVSHDELERRRAALEAPATEPAAFRLRDHVAFVAEHEGEKRRYSAFFATDLELLLRGTVVLCGMLTDVCVH